MREVAARKIPCQTGFFEDGRAATPKSRKRRVPFRKGQYGGGTVMVWDRGFWNCDDPHKAYRKGKLDFTLEGEKLEGGWILTRVRDPENEKRTNWLLIKNGDAFAREGRKNTVLDEDASVASGRSMDDIAAGKGRGPKAFITGNRSRASAKAEWISHRAASNTSAAKKRSRPLAARSKRSSAKKTSRKKCASDGDMPAFVPSQLCTSVERPPAGGDWVQEIKFDGYRIHSAVASAGPTPGIASSISTVDGSLRDVQMLAGHANLRTTQRYIEPNASAQTRVVQLV
jgi:bifunctional non-homologous end joining protein LigD